MKKVIVAMLVALLAMTSVFAVGEISLGQSKNYYLKLDIEDMLYVGFQKGGAGAAPSAEIASVFKDWTTPFVDGFEEAGVDANNFTTLVQNGAEYEGQFGIFFLVKPSAALSIKMTTAPLKSGSNEIKWASSITSNSQTYTYGSGEAAGTGLAVTELASDAGETVIYNAGAGVAHRGVALFDVTTTGGAVNAPKGNYQAAVTITITNN